MEVKFLARNESIPDKWFRNIRDGLIEKNLNRMAAMVGSTGSGKSYSAMSVGRVLRGDDFDPEKHIGYFHPRGFLRIVRSANKGDVIIFDEAGVGIDNREWQKKSQILVTQILQTFRTKNLFVIFTTPNFGYMDVKARQLFHNYVLMTGVNYKRKTATGRWNTLFVNRFDGSFKPKSMIVSIDGQLYTLPSIEHVKPPEHLCEVYEVEREKALNKLFDKAEITMEGGGRTVSIEQASKMLNIDNRIFWNLAADGDIPIDEDVTTSLRINANWIKQTRASLRLDPFTDIVLLYDGDKKPDKDSRVIPLSSGRFLATKDNKKAKAKNNPPAPNVKCPKCNYAWYTRGKLKRVRCTNCDASFLRSN